MKKVIGIIGGDNRNIYLKDILKEKGFLVKTYLLTKEDSKTLEEFLEDVEIVIGGIPFSRDSEFINTLDTFEKIKIETLFKNMKTCKRLFGGAFLGKVVDIARKYNITLYDFLDDEDFAIFNAIPTAEGALEIAIRESQIMINSSNSLVIGFGRIGKILSDILLGLHSDVYVSARKEKDFAYINAYGYKGVGYKDLPKILGKFDFIFNTVPSLILGENELSKLKKDVIIIDLASKPGGIDFDKAKELGLYVNHALGLPGKVAARSVSKYMAEKIEKIVV